MDLDDEIKQLEDELWKWREENKYLVALLCEYRVKQTNLEKYCMKRGVGLPYYGNLEKQNWRFEIVLTIRGTEEEARRTGKKLCGEKNQARTA